MWLSIHSIYLEDVISEGKNLSMTICIFFRALYMSFLPLLPLVLAALHAPLHNIASGWDKVSLNPAFCGLLYSL